MIFPLIQKNAVLQLFFFAFIFNQCSVVHKSPILGLKPEDGPLVLTLLNSK